MFHRNDILPRLMARDKAIIEMIYKCLFPKINGWISLNSGTREDAEDVFHDSLMCLITKLDTNKIQLTCDFSTYFISICRNKWLQILYKRRRLAPIKSEHYQTPCYDMYELEEEEETENKRYYAFLNALHDLDPRSQAVMLPKFCLTKSEQIKGFEMPTLLRT
jgi:RNA polymerase sigma factor (sigma-70 family)